MHDYHTLTANHTESKADTNLMHELLAGQSLSVPLGLSLLPDTSRFIPVCHNDVAYRDSISVQNFVSTSAITSQKDSSPKSPVM